jgi:hypothetical protein
MDLTIIALIIGGLGIGISFFSVLKALIRLRKTYEKANFIFHCNLEELKKSKEAHDKTEQQLIIEFQKILEAYRHESAHIIKDEIIITSPRKEDEIVVTRPREETV